VAVEKQDPLMAHYPMLKQLVVQIAGQEEARVPLFQEILSAINSHTHIKYGSKFFICS
jgi:hypothetical protein